MASLSSFKRIAQAQWQQQNLCFAYVRMLSFSNYCCQKNTCACISEGNFKRIARTVAAAESEAIKNFSPCKCHPPLPCWKISCPCPQDRVGERALLVDVVSVGHLGFCTLCGIREQFAQHGMEAKHDFFPILVLVLVKFGVKCVGCRM